MRLKVKKIFAPLFFIAIFYLLAAYLALPSFWSHYEHHRKMESAHKTTFTAQGIPGDPINVGLIGAEDDIKSALEETGWVLADPVTLKTSARIVESVLLNRPYQQAPVSNLYLWNRREDLVFEKQIGPSARERHHVRFWKAPEFSEGKLLWLGAATFDRAVGISRKTLQVTHHIAADVDQERDSLIGDLKRADRIDKIYQVAGLGPTVFGKNGNGDSYFTDGEITVAVIREERTKNPVPPTVLENPLRVQWKQHVWTWFRDKLTEIF